MLWDQMGSPKTKVVDVKMQTNSKIVAGYAQWLPELLCTHVLPV